MIGIIGAMEEEVAALKELITINKENKILDYTFLIGNVDDKEVVLLQGGIGKVNAAVCTTLLLTNYDIDYVITIGSAGGLKQTQEVGDVVISSGVAFHDFDCTAFGRKMGEIPGMPVIFEADKDLIKKAQNILHKNNIKDSIGLIVSGDQFISKLEQTTNITKYFPEALCGEMEAAAVGQVCYKFNTKFIITRSLSDVFGKGNSSIQFDEYLKKASKASAKMCIELIKE